jgi:sulfate adenylyltransferase
MNQANFLKVVNDMSLEDGTFWTLPIVLDVDTEKAAELEPNQRVLLQDPNGDAIGFLNADEVYKYNELDAAEKVFGTTESSHPGVSSYGDLGEFLVGGDIKLFEGVRHGRHDLRPSETRVLFKQHGWDTVVGFQTRNAPHRAHEYIQKSSLELVDGLLIQPKLGEKKQGDYTDRTILGGYEKLLQEYYPANRAVLSVFPSRMRYAGPREAIFDAIVRKNHGCTHFVVGRDHAGVADYYDEFGAHALFEEADIGVEPLLFDYSFFCGRCDSMCSEKICPHEDTDRCYPSGTRIREQIRNDKTPSEKIMRPEVANFIANCEKPFVTESR